MRAGCLWLHAQRLAPALKLPLELHSTPQARHEVDNAAFAYGVVAAEYNGLLTLEADKLEAVLSNSSVILSFETQKLPVRSPRPASSCIHEIFSEISYALPLASRTASPLLPVSSRTLGVVSFLAVQNEPAVTVLRRPALRTCCQGSYR